MGIQLISNIEPRNGRNYPIAHAEDIDVKATGHKLLDALRAGELTEGSVGSTVVTSLERPDEQGRIPASSTSGKVFVGAMVVAGDGRAYPVTAVDDSSITLDAANSILLKGSSLRIVNGKPIGTPIETTGDSVIDITTGDLYIVQNTTNNQ